jgi:hypothetical protein
VAVWWRGSDLGDARGHGTGGARIVDPELDMNRAHVRHRVTLAQLRRLVEWLVPQSEAIGPPMRSVARELEEEFPAAREP